MKSADHLLWKKIIDEDWNLEEVRRRLKHPRTKYIGRPLLFSALEVFRQKILTRQDDGRFILNLPEGTQLIEAGQVLSVIDSTHQQLKKNLGTDKNDPVYQYLTKEFATYDHLTNKMRFGFFAFYFDCHNNFVHVVQFPNLPTYKLALVCSASALYRDQKYQQSWYQLRQRLNKSHVLVAGASVASTTAHALLRDSRLGALTIGDPKGPNATNFNRTAYDVGQVASGESKAICFVREVHAQDPTQIIYLEPTGFSKSNFSKYLAASKDYPAVDLVVEAIDDIFAKVEILKIAQKHQLPVVQIADVGSKAEVSFNNPQDAIKGKNLILGVSNKKLDQLLKKDFLAAAMYFVGLSNAVDDETGRFLKNKEGTPFTKVTPQMGSTSLVAAGMATEKIIRYLINRELNINFAYKRIIYDKKNDYLHAQEWSDLKGLAMTLMLDFQKWLKTKRKK